MRVSIKELKELALNIEQLIAKDGESVKVDSQHLGKALHLVDATGGVEQLIYGRWTSGQLYELMHAYRRGIIKEREAKTF